jgi:NADPH-dependent ferric siderophore reductase
MTMIDVAHPLHQVTRLRRETRLRALTVSAASALTPRMRRITFTSADLHDFESAAPDDHVKLFLPDSRETGGPMPGHAMRDYTPRAFDPSEGMLTIDFALHEAGPATAWALKARVGDTLKIGGPRGSAVVADDFDWYLLIGDETALPAIGRRIEALRPGVPVTSLIVIDAAAERQSFDTRAVWTPVWVEREGHPADIADDAGLLRAALETIAFPPGDGYVWIAAEGAVARALRAFVVETRGHPRSWVKAAGYWSRGAVAAHETIED